MSDRAGATHRHRSRCRRRTARARASDCHPLGTKRQLPVLVGTDVSSRTPAREHSTHDRDRPESHIFVLATNSHPLVTRPRARSYPPGTRTRPRSYSQKKRELLVRYSYLAVFLLVRYLYLVVFLLAHGRKLKKKSYSSVGGYGPGLGAASGTYEYGKCPLPSLTRSRTRT